MIIRNNPLKSCGIYGKVQMHKHGQIRIPANCTIGEGALNGCGTVYVFAPAGGTTDSWRQGKDNIVFI